MTEEEKRASLTDAQRLFLAEIEVQLERFKTLRWLKAVPTTMPVPEGIVWAREIDTPNMTLVLSATRELLDDGVIFICPLSKPERNFLRDATAGASALEATLKNIVGFPPMTPSARRPNQPLRRSRPRRRH